MDIGDFHTRSRGYRFDGARSSPRCGGRHHIGLEGSSERSLRRLARVSADTDGPLLVTDELTGVQATPARHAGRSGVTRVRFMGPNDSPGIVTFGTMEALARVDRVRGPAVPRADFPLTISRVSGLVVAADASYQAPLSRPVQHGQ